MRHTKFKQLVLLLGLMLPTAWCGALGTHSIDGFSHIYVKQGNVQGMPKGSTIQAYIDGHTLTVAFAESLGYVQVRITTADGAPLDGMTIYTPSGIVRYIPNVGDYIVTFTLANGDEYYGEFTVTD